MEKPDLKNLKDKKILQYIEFIENKFKSPYYNSYLACKTTVDGWNEQLLAQQIDLFADKDEKSFDRAKWYFEKVLDLNKSLSELYKLMTPEEITKIGEKVKLTKDDGVEEFLKLSVTK